MGTFTAKPRNIAPNTRKANVPLPKAFRDPSSIRVGMSNVLSPRKSPDRKYRARKPSSMKAEPNRVKMKNLMAA